MTECPPSPDLDGGHYATMGFKRMPIKRPLDAGQLAAIDDVVDRVCRLNGAEGPSREAVAKRAISLALGGMTSPNDLVRAIRESVGSLN